MLASRSVGFICASFKELGTRPISHTHVPYYSAPDLSCHLMAPEAQWRMSGYPLRS